MSDDEDEEPSPVPRKADGKGKGRASVIADALESDAEKSLRAMMDIDDGRSYSIVIHVSLTN